MAPRKQAAATFFIQIVNDSDDGSDENDGDDDDDDDDDFESNYVTQEVEQCGELPTRPSDATRMVTRSMSRTRSHSDALVAAAPEMPVAKRSRKSNRGAGANATSIPNVAARHYTREENKYYASMDVGMRQRVADTEKAVHGLNQADTPLRFKVLLSEVDDKVKAIAVRKVNMLYDLDPSSPEYHKVLNWIDALCRLPIGKYCSLPVDMASPASEKQQFLMRAKEVMRKNVYGHDRAQEQVLRLIAQWITNPESKGMVIGIHGCHGCGKTTLVKEGICRAMGLPFALLPLGGASDASFLEGHSYTYEGSTWGKVVDVLMKCGCTNPVLYFDELDKVSGTHRGDEIINKLIHITDSAQNMHFSDKFFYDIELDLSRCLIIFSYNNEELVNPILKDRMIQIRTHGYSLKDKQRIAIDYLLPALLSEFSMSVSDVVFSEAIIRYMVEYIDEEEGVRNLKRAMHEIVSSINLRKLLDVSLSCATAADNDTGPLHVTQNHVIEYVKTSVRHANASRAVPMHMYT